MFFPAVSWMARRPGRKRDSERAKCNGSRKNNSGNDCGRKLNRGKEGSLISKLLPCLDFNDGLVRQAKGKGKWSKDWCSFAVRYCYQALISFLDACKLTSEVIRLL